MLNYNLAQFLIYFLYFGFTQAYFPKQLIPKRLRVKMCEKNPTLSICDSLIDSPKYLPFDQYSKWDICKFRTDLSFCQHFPIKLFSTNFKNKEIIPLKPYKSSRESNGFVEPLTTATETTKAKTTVLLSTSTTTANETEDEIEGSGESDEIKTKEEISAENKSTTNIPVLQGDE